MLLSRGKNLLDGFLLRVVSEFESWWSEESCKAQVVLKFLAASSSESPAVGSVTHTTRVSWLVGWLVVDALNMTNRSLHHRAFHH